MRPDRHVPTTFTAPGPINQAGAPDDPPKEAHHQSTHQLKGLVRRGSEANAPGQRRLRSRTT
jgi:hypothetical protein